MENDLIKIGEELKKARERKGLAVDQVQKQTRIHSTIITALEEGRCDEILPVTYVRSFLKKYSDHLGLESAELLKKYSTVHANDPRRPDSKLDSLEVRESDIVSKVIYYTSFLLLILIFFIFASFLWKAFSASLKKYRPIKIVRTAKVKAPVRAAAAKTAITKKTASKPEAKQQDRPVLSGQKKGPFNFTLKVNRSVFIKLKRDGSLIFERLMPKGFTKSLQVNEKINMQVGKAEAIEIIVDGKSLGSPGRGPIKDLEITKAGFKR